MMSTRTITAVAAAFLIFGTASVQAESTRTEYKLSFGPEKAPAGFVRVAAASIFSAGDGYGSEPGATVKGVDGGGSATDSGCVTSDAPFFFSAAVPEGNYKVTVTLGDPHTESTTTVKAELRRLMLEQIHAGAGKTVVRSFIVNVRTPKISSGGEVKLKGTRESVTEAWAWDDKLTLEFNGHHPSVRRLEIAPVEAPTVFILGDSTVCDQPAEPYASWGQMLPVFFKPEVAIANHAESGETIRSSTAAHRLEKVLSVMKPGDYLLIQFGHNDMKSKEADAPHLFKTELKDWVGQTKKKGGIPVLVTPVNRHSFAGGAITNSLGSYPDMVREAAKEEQVPLIDLNAMSKTLYESFGDKGSLELFEHDADFKHVDQTHHSPFGAYELAKCVVMGIRQTGLPLAKSVVDDLPPFDPAKPDAVKSFDVPASPTHTAERPPGD